MNINPINMTIVEWANYMVQDLDGFGQVPVLTDENEWQTWAQNLMLLGNLTGKNPPDPMGYTDFFEWAQLFNMTVLL